MLDLSNYNVYQCKDGRMRAYNKTTHSVTSYPRLVAESILGRKLKRTEDVHHIDENPLNNNPDNLEIIDHRIHEALHGGRNRKYYPEKKICPVCKKEFVWNERQQREYYSKKRIRGPYCSRSCAGKVTGPMARKQISASGEIGSTLWS